MLTVWTTDLFLALNFDGGPFLDRLFWVVSCKWTWIPLYLLILWLIYRRHGLRYTALALFFMVACVVLTDQIANFFKHHTPRLRPSRTPELEGLVHTVGDYLGGMYGTVSAHAATTFSIALFSRSVIRTRLYPVLIFFWVALVCYSRIYLGVHYPIDILLGLLDGAVVSLIAIWGFRAATTRLGLG